MKYDAFISYRHTALDMETAKKLHKALETYHIPKSVQKKTGKKKISRVFRDQEELPIGSDLNDNISNALREAEWLIVICSPDTPESYWVLKEIETFIEMHDREHVLAILIDGEPWTSFPAPLLTDDAGNPVEPLAADVRGATPKERNQKFQSEFLRIAAPVIGCTYDDLRQRHKERIIRRNITIGGIALGTVAVFGAAFGVYNAITAAKMTKLAEEKAALAEERTKLAGEILAELKEKQENQSRFYAEESTRLLKSGKREDAALLAIAALPGGEDGERPFVSEAEYALSNALYAYDDGGSYKFDRTLSHDYYVRDSFLNDDQTRLISIDASFTVSVWDTKDLTLLARIPAVLTDSGQKKNVFTANADESAIYICSNHDFLKFDYSGKLLKSINSGDSYFMSCKISTSEKKAAMVDSLQAYVVDLETFNVITTVENPQKSHFSEVAYSAKDNFMAVTHFGDADADIVHITLINTESGETKDIKVNDKSVFTTRITKKGNIAVVHADGDFFTSAVSGESLSLYSSTGNHLWTRNLDTQVVSIYPVYNLLDSRSFVKDDVENNQLVLSVQYDTFTYDEDTGTLLGKFSHASPVTGFYLYSSSNIGYFSFVNGEVCPVDTVSGLFYSEFTIKTALPVTRLLACVKENFFIIQEDSSPLMYTIKENPAPDKKELPEAPANCLYESTSPSGKYYVLEEGVDILYFFDANGEQIYSFEIGVESELDLAYMDDVCVFVSDKAFYYIDPFEKKVDKIPFDSLTENTLSMTDGNLEDNSRYAVIHNYHTLYVIDLQEKKKIGEFQIEEGVNWACVSPDGTTLYTALGDGGFHAYNVSDTSEIDLSSLGLSSSKESLTSPCIKISHDGKYLAVYGNDKKVRVLDTAGRTVKAEFPLYTSYSFFMAFSKDDKTLVVQDNDYRIYFYNIEDNSYTNTLAGDYRIKSIIYDEENGVTALTDGLNLYLVDNNSYGILAYVPKGISYCKDEKRFITKDRTSMATIGYKNYKELIEIAKKQFPDAELTEEKKIRYNVN